MVPAPVAARAMDRTTGRTGPLEREATRLSASRIISLVFLALVPLIIVFVVWEGQTAFFLLFSGMLFAAMIDAAARGLDGVLPWGRTVMVSIVVTVIVLVVLGLVAFGGAYAVQQIDGLLMLLHEQADEVSELLGLVKGGEVEEASSTVGILRQIGQLLPGGGDGASAALSAVQSAFGYLANAVIIFFIGVFLAVEPGLYRRGFERLFPPSARDNVSSALVETGQTMRWWLVGKLMSMAMIFVFTWVGLMLVGFPFAFALGLLAGALAFIPNIGPILTYVPIALVGLSAGSTSTLIYGLAVYALAQGVESYLFTPLIQKRMVSLPPALIFFVQILGGLLFGLWGVALATPLTAVIKTLIEKLYIQQGLEENVEEVDPDISESAARS